MNSSRTPAARHDLLDEVELLDPPGGEHMRLRFSGPFEGGEIRWHATLFTPGAWARCYTEPEPGRNIIDIRAREDDGFSLNVCLRVTCIDRPTVRKAVMMIRQYKRLARGRHEYG